MKEDVPDLANRVAEEVMGCEVTPTEGAAVLRLLAFALEEGRLPEERYDSLSEAQRSALFAGAKVINDALPANGTIANELAEHDLSETPVHLRTREGLNASRLLLLVMSHEDVEARVGDLIEERDRMLNQFGTTYTTFYYYWTVLGFFRRAALKNFPGRRVVEAFIKWLED